MIDKYVDKFKKEITKNSSLGIDYFAIVATGMFREIIEEKDKEKGDIIAGMREEYNKLLNKYNELQIEIEGGCPCLGNCCKSPNVVEEDNFISRCLNCNKSCSCNE